MRPVVENCSLFCNFVNYFHGQILRMASAGELMLSYDARILSEYNEVLRRPKFGFEEEKVAAFLDYIVYRGRAVTPSPLSHSLPDPADAAVAMAGVMMKKLKSIICLTCQLTARITHV